MTGIGLVIVLLAIGYTACCLNWHRFTNG